MQVTKPKYKCWTARFKVHCGAVQVNIAWEGGIKKLLLHTVSPVSTQRCGSSIILHQMLAVTDWQTDRVSRYIHRLSHRRGDPRSTPVLRWTLEGWMENLLITEHCGSKLAFSQSSCAELTRSWSWSPCWRRRRVSRFVPAELIWNNPAACGLNECEQRTFPAKPQIS